MNQNSSDRQSQPQAITRQESHDRVLEFLQSKKRGKLLDVPCGQGALASRIKHLGFDVSCCDIDVKLFKLDHIEIKEGNLNESLPYPDSAFDYVVCVAGIHRVHRMNKAILEFYRLLVPGGELIISFPNYGNLNHRLRFLFSGSISRSVNRMAFHQHFSEHPDTHFRSLLLYPQIYYALDAVGFKITGITGDSFRPRSIFLLPLMFLIATVGFLSPKKKKEEYRLRETTSMAVLLGGNNLIVSARKPV